jgi:hypothetical protein
MSFCDFKGIWWVRDTQGMSGEKPDHRVAIGGRPAAVTLICINDEYGHKFEAAKYESTPDSEWIEIQDRQGKPIHRIDFQDDQRTKILCSRIINSGGPGSWTAEDNPGGVHGPKDE